MRKLCLLVIFLMIPLGAAAKCDWGKVEDPMVQSFIDSSLARFSDQPRSTQVEKAFRFLKNKRRTKAYACDYSLAAAEHYMFARFVSLSTGDPQFADSIKTYAKVKSLLDFIGKLDWIATSDYEVSPPSDELRDWGLKGAKTGIDDYKALNPADPLNPGAADGVTESFVKKLYDAD